VQKSQRQQIVYQTINGLRTGSVPEVGPKTTEYPGFPKICPGLGNSAQSGCFLGRSLASDVHFTSGFCNLQLKLWKDLMLFSRRVLLCDLVVACLLVGCSRSPQQKEAAFLKRGSALMQRKDFSRAALEFQNAAKAMPKDAEPLYQLGLAYLAQNDVVSAVRAFRRATEIDPKHAGAQLSLAQLMAATNVPGLLDDAQKRVQGLLAADPGNVRAIVTLAITEFKLGKPDDAMALIRTELDKSPANLQSALLLARMKLAKNDVKGAEEALRQCVAGDPKSAQAELALGQFYLTIRRSSEAEKELRRALELNPKFAAALYTLALVQTQGQRLDEAEQTYRQLTTLPDKPYHPLYGKFLYSRGKRDEAIAEFRRLMTQDPKNVDLRTLLVMAYVAADRGAEARNILNEALKQNPRDHNALLQDSSIRIREGDATGAEKELRQVLQARPDSAEAHLQMALVQRMKGLSNNERQELDDALRYNPALLPARLLIARNYLHGQQPKAALEVLDRAPEEQKKTLGVITEKNWALLVLGNMAEARTSIAEALGAARTPELLLQSGVLKLLSKDYAGARAEAEAVLKMAPGDLRAAQFLVTVYSAQNQLPKAVAALAAMSAQRAQSPDLQMLYSRVLVATGQHAEARQVLEATAAAAPGNPTLKLGLAQMDAADGRFDTARQRLQTLLGQDHRNVPALVLLGQCEEQSGDPAAAKADYQAVLNIDSSNLIALNNLAYMMAHENPDEALKLAEQALQQSPQNATVLDTVGWIYYRKGLYSMAIEHLKQAVEKQPTPRRQFHLAVSYLKVGQKALGQQILATALKQDPNLTKTERDW
jgi:tetratricopeptide (TPR) repeat protein